MITFEEAYEVERARCVELLRESMNRELFRWQMAETGRTPADVVGSMWAPTWPERAAARVRAGVVDFAWRARAAVAVLRRGEVPCS